MRRAVSFAFAIALLPTLGARDAAAQCAAGGYPTGQPCADTSIGFQGCCESTGSLKWCENSVICVKSCADNPTNSCCGVSLKPGCCDPEVMKQVCSYDPSCCTDDWDSGCIVAAIVVLGVIDCPPGSENACQNPLTQCGWDPVKSFYNCSATYTADPTGQYPIACDGEPVCTPACEEKQCGDDGCGGSCGTCPPGADCEAGTCDTCEGSCFGKECGDDGCGGSCGTCPPTEECSPFGECEAPDDPGEDVSEPVPDEAEDEPVPDEPVPDEPVPDEPVVEEPTADVPVVEEPAAPPEEPAEPDAGATQPDEGTVSSPSGSGRRNPASCSAAPVAGGGMIPLLPLVLLFVLRRATP